MKRFSFYIFLLLLITCAKDSTEDNSSVFVAPSINTTNPTPTPPVTQYTLTVTAGEGGTVSTEGGTYDEGTEITITATPVDGYEFVGWEGSDSTEASLTISLGANINVQAVFEPYGFIKTELFLKDLSTKSNLDELYLDAMFSGFMRSIYMSDEANEYFIIPGQASCVFLDSGCDNISLSQTDKMPSIVLRKNIQDKWEYFKSDIAGSMYAARNYRKKYNNFLFSDGNEIGEMGQWIGPIIYGNIINNDVKFNTITKELNDYGFYHDADFGDVNGDGLIDIVAARRESQIPLEGIPGGHLGVFIQNSDGAFYMNNSIIEYPKIENGELLIREIPLSVGVSDLNNDNVSEIITYQSNFQFRKDSIGNIDLMNNPIVVWEFNSTKNKLEANFNNFNIHDINQHGENYRYEYGENIKRYAEISPTSTRFGDFNNDGLVDIAIAFEGKHVGFEIWLNTGENKFEFSFRKIFPQIEQPGEVGRYPNEFQIMDANNDGYLDIVLISNQLHLVNFLQSCCKPYSDEWTLRKEGSELSELIWINDGHGKFYKYPNALRIKNFYPNSVTPYMKNGKLHFIGVNPFQEPNGRLLRQLINGDLHQDDYYNPDLIKYIIFDIAFQL
ncbi:MAG: VCBS repeat-containing protein [Bacteroidetes bacterium]|nr:VCBS repeat-containing protein [Bacteroidota bacterium]